MNMVCDSASRDENPVRPEIARDGLAARIAAGVAHAYENTGMDDLLLLSLNIPA